MRGVGGGCLLGAEVRFVMWSVRRCGAGGAGLLPAQEHGDGGGVSCLRESSALGGETAFRTCGADGRVPHAMLLEIFTDQGAGTLVHK